MVRRCDVPTYPYQGLCPRSRPARPRYAWRGWSACSGALANKPELVWITAESLPEVVTELGRLWPPTEVPPGEVRSFTRPLVFTTMDLSYTRPDLSPLLKRCPEGTSLGTST